MLKERYNEAAGKTIKSEYEYLQWYKSLKRAERNKVIEDHRRRILLEGVQTMLSDIEEQEAEEAFSKYAGYSLEDVYRELVEEDNTPGKGK